MKSRVFDFPKRCIDLSWREGTRKIVLVVAARATCPIPATSQWFHKRKSPKIFRHICPLDPGESGYDFENMFYWSVSSDLLMIKPLSEPRDFIGDKSTLIQAMAWCHHASSHNLGQWWPISLLPYDVTRPQWLNPSGMNSAVIIPDMICTVECRYNAV